MRASDLRHKIEFQSATTTADGRGGKEDPAWATDRTTRAKIASIGSENSYENAQVRAKAAFEVTTRYLKDYDVTHKVRIKWDSRYFTPVAPVNVDNIKKWMVFNMVEWQG